MNLNNQTKHMKQVLRRTYFSALGKTKIETKDGIVWADNNLTEEAHGAMTLVNIQLNEIGDTFVAYKDSTTLDGEGEDAKPIFLKGDTVTRKKQSMDFMSVITENPGTQFAFGAFAFGLNLQVVLQK